MNQDTFSNYHAALGNGSFDNCSGGSYTGLWYNQHVPLASGCFVNGYYYLNDYHVFISSPLTKNKSTFSDYHWRWGYAHAYTGDCCFGLSNVDALSRGIIPYCGIFHQMCQNEGINYNDERLCSRLSKIP